MLCNDKSTLISRGSNVVVIESKSMAKVQIERDKLTLLASETLAPNWLLTFLIFLLTAHICLMSMTTTIENVT